MGILNKSQYQYYANPFPDLVEWNIKEKGDYQFVSLDNIITAFIISYVGESKLINKVNRTDVQFHAMRAIQELSYDVFRSIKSQEIEVPPSLKMMLPQDYVNYVKLVRVDNNGIERILYPTGKSSNPFAIRQYSDDNKTYQHLISVQDDIMEQVPSGSSNTWDNYTDQTEASTTDATDASNSYSLVVRCPGYQGIMKRHLEVDP